jgi:hypothetical protein
MVRVSSGNGAGAAAELFRKQKQGDRLGDSAEPSFAL